MKHSVEWRDLPGAELIEKGLSDAALGILTPESLLLQVGNSRLRNAGLDVPPLVTGIEAAELRLYRLLGESGVEDTYSAYQAILRRFVSFEAGLERRWYAEERLDPVIPKA